MDTWTRDFSKTITSDINVIITADWCISQCSSQGFSYAGMQAALVIFVILNFFMHQNSFKLKKEYLNIPKIPKKYLHGDKRSRESPCCYIVS